MRISILLNPFQLQDLWVPIYNRIPLQGNLGRVEIMIAWAQHWVVQMSSKSIQI